MEKTPKPRTTAKRGIGVRVAKNSPLPASSPDIGCNALSLLCTVAGADMLASAIPILRDQMRLTPEKLALLLHRLLNPDHVPGEAQEAIIRGMSAPTLRAMKQAKELPTVLARQ